MTKRAEWVDIGIGGWSQLVVGTVEVNVWHIQAPDDLWHWRVCYSDVRGATSFASKAAAQAAAVRWLRATIAEMAAACPEVE